MEEVEVKFLAIEPKEVEKKLKKIGFKEKFYGENKRICYQKGKIEFDIDFLAGLRTIFGD